MLHLNRKTEYALLALAHLNSVRKGALANASEISERFSIPPMILSKVLQELKFHNYVTSTKGRSGGYSMNCTPAEIPFTQLLKDFGESTRLVSCESNEGELCHCMEQCVIQEPLQQLESVIMDSLTHLTLADAIGQSKKHVAA